MGSAKELLVILKERVLSFDYPEYVSQKVDSVRFDDWKSAIWTSDSDVSEEYFGLLNIRQWIKGQNQGVGAMEQIQQARFLAESQRCTNIISVPFKRSLIMDHSLLRRKVVF